jgi:DNA-binding MltR family transcriptional regulator
MPLIHLSTTTTEEIRQTLVELAQDSDRAAGIVGAVLVDDALTVLLKSRLQRDEDLIKDIFRASGPLGSFNTKITMGFLMGLYSKDAWKELNTIKEIRNQFAHHIARSFAFERIRDLAKNLSLAEEVEFHVRMEVTGAAWLNTKPPADMPTTPLLPPISPDKLDPRERYLRSCQFYSAAFFAMAESPSAPQPF